MAYISFVRCVMSLLFRQQHVLLMHFFCACVLGDKNLCNNKYRLINQTDDTHTQPKEEQPQPQQVLRGNHLSSCEGGFAL